MNNKERDLFALLRLVDPDTFGVEEVFPQVMTANEPLLKARQLALDPTAKGMAIQEHLRTAASHPLLAGNRQLAGLIERDLSEEYLAEKANRVDLANRIERVNLLRHTVNRTRKVEVLELKVHRRHAGNRALMPKFGKNIRDLGSRGAPSPRTAGAC